MQIEWTDIALDSLKDVIEYTKEQFGDSQVKIISHKILNTIDCITSLPTAFPLEPLLTRKKPIYRSAIVIKELKIVYRQMTNDHILVLFVWNTRMSAREVKKRLRIKK